MDDWLGRAYQQANEWYGRHGIIASLILWLVVPAAVVSMLLWLASRAEWIWGAFGLFGFAIIGLFGWATTATIIAAIRTARTMQSIKQKLNEISEPLENKESIDWGIWKRREKYSARETPRLLAKENPLDHSIGQRAQAIQRLLFEAMKNKSIAYTPEYLFDGKTEKQVSYDTDIPRDIALKWARENGIDTSHVD